MSLTKRIIPCLDVANGRVVKGLNFTSIKDAGDPVALAKRYSDEGADELIFLDITASEQKRQTILTLVKQVAKVIDIPFTVGGGVQTLQHARDILLCGADKVAINTAAIKNPGILTELMKLFGKQCVVVAIDAKRNYHVPDDTSAQSFWFEVFVYGGKKATSVDAVRWAKEAANYGAGEILLTSIDRDGTKKGYDEILVRKVVDSVSIPVIASGGCGTAEHMAEIFKRTDVDAALAASIFHYDSEGIVGVKQFLRQRQISVRL